ncbi:hypothetical protein G9H64_01680 [Aquirufa nivalisilvae]|nr:hypothetical protein [Aquirufa nivalisilvae]MCZ2481652.1 hypothetical protein [Aquirufa nivalisilvae]
MENENTVASGASATLIERENENMVTSRASATLIGWRMKIRWLREPQPP